MRSLQLLVLVPGVFCVIAFEVQTYRGPGICKEGKCNPGEGFVGGRGAVFAAFVARRVREDPKRDGGKTLAGLGRQRRRRHKGFCWNGDCCAAVADLLNWKAKECLRGRQNLERPTTKPGDGSVSSGGCKNIGC